MLWNKNWLQISIKWSLALSPFSALKLDWKKAKWSLEKLPLLHCCCFCCCCSGCCCCSCCCCCGCCCSCVCCCCCGCCCGGCACCWWSILHNNKFSSRSRIICIKYVTEKKLACCNDMKVGFDRWKCLTDIASTDCDRKLEPAKEVVPNQLPFR